MRSVPGLVAGVSALALDRARGAANAAAGNDPETVTAASGLTTPAEIARTTSDPEAAGLATPAAGAETGRGPAAAAPPPRVFDPELLPATLARLADAARSDGAAAFAFACDETVTAALYNLAGDVRQRGVWQLEYVYTRDPAAAAPESSVGQARDHRTVRGESDTVSDEPFELADLGLPAVSLRPYAWAFLFQDALQERYRFELIDEQESQGRSALVIAFEPRAPVAAGVNDWFGRAWVDTQTHRVLRIEALQAGDYAGIAEDGRVTLNVPRDGRLIVRLEAVFGIDDGERRLPSEVVVSGEDYSMHALALGLPGGLSSATAAWDRRGRVAFRVAQRYENCRFLDVGQRDP